jgi:glycosyltransferase involved in cell wall biosynthesis
MKYSIIVPTYNHCDDLLKPCLESVFRYTDMRDVELIVSANGCTDSTKWYLESLKNQFASIGFEKHFQIIWSDKPLGYSGANNAAIKQAHGERIVLLNNDTVLLHQHKNCWLEMLSAPFENDSRVGLAGPVIQHSSDAGQDFCVFFCVMIAKKVFDKIGLLNEEYGVGTGEDVEFSIEAVRAGFLMAEVAPKALVNGQFYTSTFPLYHKGEGTVHDFSLVLDFNSVFARNGRKLARKYNPKHYKWSLMNNFERYVAIKGEEVMPREKARYQWAASRLIGGTVFEVGCSNGYGSQFFGDQIDYLGVDYNPQIVEVANEEGWGANKRFVHADINTFELGHYDTIVAMEVIEHLDNGLEIAQRLKNHCKRLLITVPYMEEPGFWGEHHRLHRLNQTHLPGFEYKFMGEQGNISETPFDGINLMLCEYNA